MLQVKGQGEIFPGQDFDRGRRSTYSVSRRDTPLLTKCETLLTNQLR